MGDGGLERHATSGSFLYVFACLRMSDFHPTMYRKVLGLALFV